MRRQGCVCLLVLDGGVERCVRCGLSTEERVPLWPALLADSVWDPGA